LRSTLVALAASLLLGACSPALNWREVRPADSAAQLLFPCKPSSHARDVDLAGQRTPVTLYACEAADMTFAVAFAALEDPSRVSPALQDWRRAAQDNLGASQVRPVDFKVPGQTPNPQSSLLHIQGRRPDGSSLSSQVLLAVKGTQVFQVTVLGSSLDPQAAETFMQSVRLLP